MAWLSIATLYWIGIHLLVAGPARGVVAARIGENGFRGLFSLLSLVGLVGLILAYRAAPFMPLWAPMQWTTVLALPLVFFAFLLLILSLTADNATSVGGELNPPARLQVSGVTRITRHPMLWAFSLWAFAHLLTNGHLAALLFFGSIMVVALNGMVSIDRKRRRALGPVWDDFAARTSRIPFAAILGGRAELRLGELPPWRLALATILFAGTLYLHGWALGVSPLP